jgi:ATP-dependent Clp protease ATP-binding subunit ClpA
MGARPLSRVIQEQIKKPLADELLFGKLAKGGLVKIGIKNNEIDLQIIERENILISKKKVALLPAK